jgi:hypothetical protein
MRNENDTISWRMSNVEKQVGILDGKVEDILTTSLPRLQDSITKLGGKFDSLSTKVSVAMGVNIVLLVGSILGIVLIIER